MARPHNQGSEISPLGLLVGASAGALVGIVAAGRRFDWDPKCLIVGATVGAVAGFLAVAIIVGGNRWSSTDR